MVGESISVSSEFRLRSCSSVMLASYSEFQLSIINTSTVPGNACGVLMGVKCEPVRCIRYSEFRIATSLLERFCTTFISEEGRHTASAGCSSSKVLVMSVYLHQGPYTVPTVVRLHSLAFAFGSRGACTVRLQLWCCCFWKINHLFRQKCLL